MGTPGRRVRRDGPAASSGCGGARGVRRRRGARRRGTSTSIRRAPRRASRAFDQRAPTLRQAAHGGAPWRSHAFTARRRRSSLVADVRRGSCAEEPRPPTRRRTPAPEFIARRRTAKLPRRRSPRAWERRGVASDATARRPRRGAAARGGVRRRRGARRRGTSTSIRRAPRRASRAFVQRAPTRRQAAHGGAPWRSHAFTARRRRSSSVFDVPLDSRAEGSRPPRCRRTPAPKNRAHRPAGELPHRISSLAVAPQNSRADARRVHGNAGASRPTRRPGGLVGVRRRAGSPPTTGAAPTSTADVDRRRRFADVAADRRPPSPFRRRRFAVRPDARRMPSFNAPRRAAKPRTEARLGAPMRSPRVDVGVHRRPTHLSTPAPNSRARRRPPPARRRPSPARDVDHRNGVASGP
jgi:hypothetical protein